MKTKTQVEIECTQCIALYCEKLSDESSLCEAYCTKPETSNEKGENVKSNNKQPDEALEKGFEKP